MVTMVKPLLDGLLSVQYALSDLDLLSLLKKVR